jgi:hypothetical protein
MGQADGRQQGAECRDHRNELIAQSWAWLLAYGNNRLEDYERKIYLNHDKHLAG